MDYITATSITFGGIIGGGVDIAGADSTIINYGDIEGNIQLGQGSDSLDLRPGHYGGVVTIDPFDTGAGDLPGGSTGAYNDIIYVGDDPTVIKIIGGDPNLDLTVYATRAATTVDFDIASTDATVTQNLDGSWTVDAGQDGTETLFGVTTLEFTDTSIQLPVIPVNPNDFNGDGRSDFLIENTAGTVVVGEVGSNDQTTYAQIGALGPEWSFVGHGDFLGDTKSDFLIENTSGAVVVGEIGGGGQAVYTQIGTLGPEWTFQGTGDLLDDGHKDFLIENTAGAVVVGEVGAGDQAVYTQIGNLGPEWSFHGTGDFFDDGHTDFLIENTSGSVYVGEVGAGNQTTYTAIASLGPEWSFVGTGDFMADGETDFLIQNTNGQLVVGELGPGNQEQYTTLTTLAAGSKVVGVGDFLGEGHDQFLIETAAGAVQVGDYLNGQLHVTQVAALGSEWAFH